MLITDTHCHLDAPEFEADRDAVLQRAAEAGVGRMVCVGTDLASSLRCVELAGRFPGAHLRHGRHPSELLGGGRAGRLGPRRGAGRAAGGRGRRRERAGLPLHLHVARGAGGRLAPAHPPRAMHKGKPIIIHARNADAEVLSTCARRARLPVGCGTARPAAGRRRGLPGAGVADRGGCGRHAAGLRQVQGRSALSARRPSAPGDRRPLPVPRLARRRAQRAVLHRRDASGRGRPARRATESVASLTSENADRLFGLAR